MRESRKRPNVVRTYKRLSEVKKALKNKKVVYAAGCFDIIHEGHVAYLEKVKTFGDVLIVGILPGAYITLNKGRKPIRPQGMRAAIVAALRAVDFVFLIPPITAKKPSMRTVMALRPNVFVTRSKRYKSDRSLFRNLGVTLQMPKMKKIYSTRRIIKRIISNSKKSGPRP